jgi:hypothetical protein
MDYAPPDSPAFAAIIDESRCADRNGQARRCQLVVGHPGEDLVQRNGKRLGRPVGAEPQPGTLGRRRWLAEMRTSARGSAAPARITRPLSESKRRTPGQPSRRYRSHSGET